MYRNRCRICNVDNSSIYLCNYVITYRFFYFMLNFSSYLGVANKNIWQLASRCWRSLAIAGGLWRPAIWRWPGWPRLGIAGEPFFDGASQGEVSGQWRSGVRGSIAEGAIRGGKNIRSGSFLLLGKESLKYQSMLRL